jgi:hypothetical protein
VGLGKTIFEFLFHSFFFTCYFLLIKLCFVKQWLTLMNTAKQILILTYTYMQNKRHWEDTNFQKITFVFVSILPGEEMKYLPSGLVEVNGKMASWKESYVPMDRARENLHLNSFTLSKKTYILLSD